MRWLDGITDSVDIQFQRKAMPKNFQATTQVHSSHTLVKQCFSSRRGANPSQDLPTHPLEQRPRQAHRAALGCLLKPRCDRTPRGGASSPGADLSREAGGCSHADQRQTGREEPPVCPSVHLSVRPGCGRPLCSIARAPLNSGQAGKLELRGLRGSSLLRGAVGCGDRRSKEVYVKFPTVMI